MGPDRVGSGPLGWDGGVEGGDGMDRVGCGGMKGDGMKVGRMEGEDR